jgi:hypothetical protein
MKKYIGEIFWIVGNYKDNYTEGCMQSVVNRAILNEGVFRIDHQNPNNFPDGEIRLRSKDDFNFEGSMKYIDDKTTKIMVNLKLYKNKKEALLIGTWKEDGTIFNCIIELTEVKEFKV